MSADATTNEMTVREFFDKLQERLMHIDDKTGETLHVLARDKELISTLRAYYKLEELDDKDNGSTVFNICWILHCLRQALYNVITQDIKGPYSKHKAIETYKNVLKTDYEKEDELKT